MIKDALIGIMDIHLIIMWLIMLPFILIFDRIWRGWKNEKKNSR